MGSFRQCLNGSTLSLLPTVLALRAKLGHGCFPTAAEVAATSTLSLVATSVSPSRPHTFLLINGLDLEMDSRAVYAFMMSSDCCAGDFTNVDSVVLLPTVYPKTHTSRFTKT